MNKQQPDLKLTYAGTFILFGWLIFLASWLWYYAGSFSIFQNIAVFLLSLVVFLTIIALLLLPQAMKRAD